MKLYVNSKQNYVNENDESLTAYEKEYGYIGNTNETPCLQGIEQKDVETLFQDRDFIRTYVDEYVTNASEKDVDAFYQMLGTRSLENAMLYMEHHYEMIFDGLDEPSSQQILENGKDQSVWFIPQIVERYMDYKAD